MERSWWIVLVLICNLAYGQINSGAIGNNRFLQRTNPQIDRAIADGGSSLDHPELQKLARQMVDLGIWSNLVLWVHEGLVKERVSGSDVFVTKVYDISDSPLDFAQTDTTKQPKLSNGFLFDGTNDDFSGQTVTSKLRPTSISVSFYCNLQNTANFDGIVDISGTGLNRVLVMQRNNRIRIQVFVNNVQKSYGTDVNITGGWVMFSVTYSSNSLLLYLNGSLITSPQVFSENTIGNLAIPSNATIQIGRNINANTSTLTGNVSDIRIFNTVLTATQIDAIFQETRGKYGI